MLVQSFIVPSRYLYSTLCFPFLLLLFFPDLLEMSYLVGIISFEFIHIFIILRPRLLSQYLEWLFLQLCHVLPYVCN